MTPTLNEKFFNALLEHTEYSKSELIPSANACEKIALSFAIEQQISLLNVFQKTCDDWWWSMQFTKQIESLTKQLNELK
jgi:hypothetical protein